MLSSLFLAVLIVIASHLAAADLSALLPDELTSDEREVIEAAMLRPTGVTGVPLEEGADYNIWLVEGAYDVTVIADPGTFLYLQGSKELDDLRRLLLARAKQRYIETGVDDPYWAKTEAELDGVLIPSTHPTKPGAPTWTVTIGSEGMYRIRALARGPWHLHFEYVSPHDDLE